MAPPFETPDAAAALCWQLLVRATRDRRAAWRTPVLSTSGLDGGPRARVLVLRKAEPADGVLWLHTDVRSAKLAELAADSRAALTFWDGRANLQLRIDGRARIESDPGVLAEAWARVPAPARRNYSTVEAPGTPAAGPVAHGESGAANFGMIAIRAERLEWLWLGPEHQLRGAAQRRHDGWATAALTP